RGSGPRAAPTGSSTPLCRSFHHVEQHSGYAMNTEPLVGILLVSHSAELAAGTADLAGQVSGGAVPIVAAGGGVVVLSDLGSAVLTVRALLEDRPSGRVIMADGPFVEGAVAATVTAAAGADIKAVASAAEEARHARKL